MKAAGLDVWSLGALESPISSISKSSKASSSTWGNNKVIDLGANSELDFTNQFSFYNSFGFHLPLFLFRTIHFESNLKFELSSLF